MTKTCVVGAGRMGSALARALLAEGIEMRVWNRSREKVAALVAAGANTAESLAEAVAASDVVIVNVIDYAAADALLRMPAVERALAGKVLVQLTSGSPGQAREAGRWAAERGIAYLDGAIMATPNFIGGAETTILYSGTRPAFERHRDVLRAFGGNGVFVGEDAGHASALDTGLLTQMWGKLFGTLQALAVVRAEGIGLEAYARYMRDFQPVVDAATDDLIARVGEGRWRGDAATLATIEAHYSAFHHLLAIGDEHGLDRTLPAALDGLFKAALAAGHAADDFAALVRCIERGGVRHAA